MSDFVYLDQVAQLARVPEVEMEVVDERDEDAARRVARRPCFGG
jgi:hypothetical protein